MIILNQQPSWGEVRTQMQLKLEHMMSITEDNKHGRLQAIPVNESDDVYIERYN